MRLMIFRFWKISLSQKTDKFLLIKSLLFLLLLLGRLKFNADSNFAGTEGDYTCFIFI